MRTNWKVLMLMPVIQLALDSRETAYAQRWYMPPAGGMHISAAPMVNGRIPGGVIGTHADFGANAGLPQSFNAGPAPFSAGAAPPIGTPVPGTGSINNGGAFGGGSVAGNGQLNGALADGIANPNGTNTANGSLNGYAQGTSNGTASAYDAALYSSLYAGSSGGGGYYGYGSASDPISSYESAYDNGIANIIRAQGAYELADTQAMINFQKARTRYVDNQQKLFYARQDLKRQVAANQTEDRETVKANRIRQDEFLASHRPPPLSHDELDPWNGAIRWPVALMAPDFDDLRASLSDSFAQRVKGYDKSVVASKILQDVEDMRYMLQQKITLIPLHDYSEARIFLDSMTASAR